MNKHAPLVCRLPSRLNEQVRQLMAKAEKGQQKCINDLTAQIVKAAGLNQTAKVKDLQADRKAMRLRGKFINLSNVIAAAMRCGIEKLPTDPVALFEEVCKGEVTVGRPTRREPVVKEVKAA